RPRIDRPSSPSSWIRPRLASTRRSRVRPRGRSSSGLIAVAILTLLGVIWRSQPLTSLAEGDEMSTAETRRWRFRGPEMEGPIARWYARIRGSQNQLSAYRKQARELTAGLPSGADVLEVAPGPGYLAIEIARLGYRL